VNGDDAAIAERSHLGGPVSRQQEHYRLESIFQQRIRRFLDVIASARAGLPNANAQVVLVSERQWRAGCAEWYGPSAQTDEHCSGYSVDLWRTAGAIRGCSESARALPVIFRSG